jgi:hypothetical protein
MSSGLPTRSWPPSCWRHANARVRRSLEKCVAKVGKSQLKDGSWNIAGTGRLFSEPPCRRRTCKVAKGKGVAVPPVPVEPAGYWRRMVQLCSGQAMTPGG